MNNRYYTLILIVLIVALPAVRLTAQSNDPTDKIIQSIRKSNASELAGYFGSTIDLEIGTADGNYSKKQAEIIMKDFFEKNPLQSFTVNHNGSSNDGSQYMIGSYSSKSNKKFRVYVLLKKSGEQLLISQLQFEAD